VFAVFRWLAPANAANRSLTLSFPSLLGIYKDIHSHPELSGYEGADCRVNRKGIARRRAARSPNISGKYENSKLKGYGVVGVDEEMGDGADRACTHGYGCVASGRRKTGLPYASKTRRAKTMKVKDVHVMHACGHDAHMAAFIGTARASREAKRSMGTGTIVFVAQPAEGDRQWRRARLLKDGLFTKKFG